MQYEHVTGYTNNVEMLFAEDPRKCSVECEVVWMSGSLESCKQ